MNIDKLWFVLDMDEGVRGVFHTKAAAIEDRCPRNRVTVKVHRFGPGAYQVVWRYQGSSDDGDDFFLERGDAATNPNGAGGWEDAIRAWEEQGAPIEPNVTLGQPFLVAAEDGH